MEQIRFHPYIKEILEPLELHNSKDFLHGVQTVLAYLEGNTVIEPNKILIEQNDDLFETLKHMDLGIYGIVIFKTSSGSVYLWDKQSNASLRFRKQDSVDQKKKNSYQLMKPSETCTFFSENNKTRLTVPVVGVFPKEFLSYKNDKMEYHDGHKIIEVS